MNIDEAEYDRVNANKDDVNDIIKAIRRHNKEKQKTVSTVGV